jgi:cyclopropane-fatty-acyl-phospholipid synthase
MDISKIGRIKNAVRSHFNDSPAHYDAFERRYGFFADLALKLVGPMAIGPKAAILDVGCGSGASTTRLAACFPEAQLWGLDLSSAMLAAARASAGSSERICFIEGDAGNLGAAFSRSFDAIIYTACIFLIPDFAASLAQANALLAPRGSVGCSYMDGVYDSGGGNAFVAVERRLNLGLSIKKPVALTPFIETFQQMFDNVTIWNEDIEVTSDFLRDFFRVPAMSAGLFPGHAYPQRAERVEQLVAGLDEPCLGFRWYFAVGRHADQ